MVYDLELFIKHDIFSYDRLCSHEDIVIQAVAQYCDKNGIKFEKCHWVSKTIFLDHLYRLTHDLELLKNHIKHENALLSYNHETDIIVFSVYYPTAKIFEEYFNNAGFKLIDLVCDDVSYFIYAANCNGGMNNE